MFKLPEFLKTSRWRYVVGGLIVFVGIICLVLPVGPGLFLIFLGLYIINTKWSNEKLQQLKHLFERWSKKWKHLWERWSKKWKKKKKK